MIVRTYRCYHCDDTDRPWMKGFNFKVEHSHDEVKVKIPGTVEPGYSVSCPQCEVKNTEGEGVIVPVLVIHYEAPKNTRHPNGKGVGHIACDVTKKTGASDTLRYTGETGVATCPKCKETAAFKSASGGRLDETYELGE